MNPTAPELADETDAACRATPAELFQPESERRLEQVLHRFLQVAATLDERFRYQEPLAIKVGLDIRQVRPADIRWIEAQSDYVRIHAAEQRHLVRLTLKELLQRLPASRFVRIHRSSVVNVDYLRSLGSPQTADRFALLTDGTQLRVSEAGYKALLEALNLSGK